MSGHPAVRRAAAFGWYAMAAGNNHGCPANFPCVRSYPFVKALAIVTTDQFDVSGPRVKTVRQGISAIIRAFIAPSFYRAVRKSSAAAIAAGTVAVSYSPGENSSVAVPSNAAAKDIGKAIESVMP